MSDLPEKLHADEALLWMYLADELPHAEKVTLDARLAAEANLREQLEALRAAHESVYAALGASDAVTPLVVTEPVAVRRVGRAIAQWQADRLTAPAAAGHPHRLRLHYPSWVYPTAAAAIVLVSFIVWRVNRSDNAGQVATTNPTDAPQYAADNTSPNTTPAGAQVAPPDGAAVASAEEPLPDDDAVLAADLEDSLPDTSAPIARLERMQRETVALGNLDPVLPTPAPDEVSP